MPIIVLLVLLLIIFCPVWLCAIITAVTLIGTTGFIGGNFGIKPAIQVFGLVSFVFIVIWAIRIAIEHSSIIWH